MNKRRLGRMRCSPETMDPKNDEFHAVMSDVRVLDRRNDFGFAEYVELLIEGNVLDEIEMGERIPEYVVEITQHWDDNGNKLPFTHRWRRI